MAFLLAAPVSAQAEFVHEIVQPGGMSTLVSAIQAPYETSGPDTSPLPRPFLTRWIPAEIFLCFQQFGGGHPKIPPF